ncbi:unnamed protein product [Cuscuta epithymum]|uniref:Uncharacterized protein n=1 Tax=Cuscuta epithymum TaxID=186058 RepID=A0AAV0FRM4_9ASTE|nr:unnamed protein product [Cuscuta epithymum]
MRGCEVSSISKRTVVSTKPVQPAGKFSPLSLLDRAMQHYLIRLVFYYRKIDKNVKLGESISETLNAYERMTGRLMRSAEDEKWLMKCNDAGLRLVEAKVKGITVAQWLQNVDREKELQLAHWEPILLDPYFSSPFYIQITEFEEGGVAIGLSCTHLLADPVAATMFMKAWADISFAGKMLCPPHFHPFPAAAAVNKQVCTRNNNNSLIKHYCKFISTQKQMYPAAKRTSTITLLFSDQMVMKCMSMAQTVADAHGGGAFEALAGLFWTRISKVKNMDLVVGLDVRKVLGLDKGFFGNCMVYNKAAWNKESMKMGDIDLPSQAATEIRNLVKEMDRESVMELMEWLQQNPGDVLIDGGCDSLVCANLEDLDSYSACFGDRPPMHVSCYIEPADAGIGSSSKLVILPSPPPGTGPFSRTVMLTLPENEAFELMEDQFIQQLSPSVKMHACN